MAVRFCQASDFHLDEDRYVADTAQCLEWFVADAVHANVSFFVIKGELTTYKDTIKEQNLWVDFRVDVTDHAPVMLLGGNHGAELERSVRVWPGQGIRMSTFDRASERYWTAIGQALKYKHTV